MEGFVVWWPKQANVSFLPKSIRHDAGALAAWRCWRMGYMAGYGNGVADGYGTRLGMTHSWNGYSVKDTAGMAYGSYHVLPLILRGRECAFPPSLCNQWDIGCLWFWGCSCVWNHQYTLCKPQMSQLFHGFFSSIWMWPLPWNERWLELE